MATDRLTRLRALMEQWRENANEIGPRLEGAAFEQCANQLAAELEGVLAILPHENAEDEQRRADYRAACASDEEDK